MDNRGESLVVTQPISGCCTGEVTQKHSSDGRKCGACPVLHIIKRIRKSTSGTCLKKKERFLCSVTMPEIRDNHQSQCQRPQQHVNVSEVNFLTLTKWCHISLLVKPHLSKKENMKLIGYIKQPHLHCIFAQRWNTIVWNVNNNNKLLSITFQMLCFVF